MSGRDSLRKGDWLGEYEIRGRMRAGGMATLFLAQRHGAAGVSRPVVIKVIHPHLAEDEQMVRMFIDEARISSHIRHSNVVYVEKFGEHEGLYFMVMEYVDGCSLLQVIRSCAAEGRKLSTAIAVHIAIEVAAGLHAAHETLGDDGAPLGIVHRDVSPSNVLLTRDGRVKVIDFGIAKAHGRLGATRSGSGIKGKLCYMSPEQAWGDPIDRRIDIYALGICLWELLTAQQLFRAESDLALLELVRNPTIPLASTRHPDVSAALDAAMSRATARRPADRHATAFDLRRDLMAAVPGAVAVPPETIGELVRHVCERERKTAQLAAPHPPPAALDPLLPVPAETSVRSAAGEIEPRPWRNRGILAATFLGACALGGLVALAIASSGPHAPSPPAQAIQAPPPPPANASDATRVPPASAASAPDATGARSATAPSGSDANGARSASATAGGDATGARAADGGSVAIGAPSATATSADDATGRSADAASATDTAGARAASAASPSDATGARSASTTSASDTTGARSATAASVAIDARSPGATSVPDTTGARSANAPAAGDATRARSANAPAAADATRARPANAPSAADATGARSASAASANGSSDAGSAPGAAKPGRRTGATRAEKSRVTTVEVDGAVLADEGAAPAKAPARLPTKPKPKPAGAVRAGDAILAE